MLILLGIKKLAVAKHVALAGESFRTRARERARRVGALGVHAARRRPPALVDVETLDCRVARVAAQALTLVLSGGVHALCSPAAPALLFAFVHVF